MLLALALAPLQPRLQDAASNENEAFLVGLGGVDRGQRPDRRALRAGPRGHRARGLHAAPTGRSPRTTTRASTRRCARSASRARSPTSKSVVTPSGVACGEPGRRAWRRRRRLARSPRTARRRSPPWRPPTRTPRSSSRTSRRCASGSPDRTRDGLRTYVTGEAGFTADASEAYEGIDRTLLAITLVLVLVLLLATYRSPIVAMVPLVAVALAYLIAAGVVYGLFEAGRVRRHGPVHGDPDRADVRRGHGLLPAARLALPGGAARRRATRRRRWRARPRAAAARSSPRAPRSSRRCSCSRSPTSARRASMGPVLALGHRGDGRSPGSRCCPRCWRALGPRAFWPATRGRRAAGAGRVWDRIVRLVRARPGAVTAAVLAHARGRRARQPRGARHARLHRELPRPAGVRPRPGRDPARVRAGPGGAGAARRGTTRPLAGRDRRARRQPATCAAATMVSYSTRRGADARRRRAAADPFSEAARDAVPRAARRRARGGRGRRPALLGGLHGGDATTRARRSAPTRR